MAWSRLSVEVPTMWVTAYVASGMTHPLPKRRRTLLPVRRHALDDIGPGEADELVGERGVERRELRPVPVVQRVLRPPDRALRAAGELHRDVERRRVHLGRVDGERHEP